MTRGRLGGNLAQLLLGGYVKRPKLLTRDQFREAVFARDNYKCVVCGEPAKDAHHVIDRKLFSDGGYYLDNGASVCEMHHLDAEMTIISVEQIRDYAGITNVVVPEHYYPDELITKWGDPILPNGQRLRGELFDDPSVQRILSKGGVLGLYQKYIKYPRTMQLPWSPGRKNKNERTITSLEKFEGRDVVVHIKMDGENTTMYSDYMHARSLEYSPHESRNLIKSIHAQIAHNIPEGFRVCCENVYAKHSIHYKNLSSYLYGFSIWDEKNFCLSWPETKEWLALIGIESCPVLYEGKWDEKLLKTLYKPVDALGNECEGYVVRVADKFHYRDFSTSVAKFVRENHVQTHHWKFQRVIPNELAPGIKKI